MFINDSRSIAVDIKGTVTGQQFMGVFKIKPLLSHRDKLRRDQLKRELLGVQSDQASEAAYRTAEVFSKLWCHIIESPSWWKDASNGLDLLDEEPIVFLIEAIVKMEQEILDGISKQGEESKKDLTELSKQVK